MAVPVRTSRQPEMLLMHGQGHRQHVWPAEPLQLGGDVNEIQVRMIAAIGADQFERIGVAAFVPAVDDTDRAPPNERRPAVPRLAGQREPREDLSADTESGVTGTAGGRCRNRAAMDSRPGTGHGLLRRGTAHYAHRQSLTLTGLSVKDGHCRGLEQRYSLLTY
jgi:hypothetical protein